MTPTTKQWWHSNKTVTQTFYIPVTFEFRRVDVQWMHVCPNIIGWEKRQDGALDPLHLIAEIGDRAGTRRITLPSSHLPEIERKRCLATTSRHDADKALTRICSSVQMPVFTHNRRTYIAEGELIKHSVPANVTQMRADFFRINKEDAESALSFLNTWGRWIPFRNYVDLAEVLELQQAVRDALTNSPTKWLGSHYSDLPRARSRSRELPYFGILTDACEVAIRVATTIDVLRRTEFRVCARPDCAVPFAVESKHNRIYCQKYCAHLESVRRGRTAQRTA